jgi:hypothetical protein
VLFHSTTLTSSFSFLAQARHGLPLNVVPLAFLTFYVAVTTSSLKLERLLPISI